MDGGPYRVPRPAERRATGARQDSASRQVDEPQLAREESAPVYRASPRQPVVEDEKSWKRFVLPAAVALLVVALLVMSWFMFFGNKGAGGAPAIDSSKYQAVFFTNGQVYFGKLSSLDANYLRLTDVYYLQSQQSEEADDSNPQDATSDQSSSATLIKLGEEIHGPEDEMVISRDQVLFYENLKSDGSVSESISQNQN